MVLRCGMQQQAMDSDLDWDWDSEEEEEEGSVRVEVVRERTVTPDSAAAAAAISMAAATAAAGIHGGDDDEEMMYLSPADVFCRGIQHNRRILFYDPPTIISYDHLVSRLAASLSAVLASFFPLAGRLVGEGRRMRLALNNAGALLREAVVTGVTIDELRRSSFANLPAFSRLAPSFPPELYASVPVLAAQISLFDCGGIALGVSINHIVCDGTSLWHFMMSWAECARGEPISVPPLHARTMLRVENTSVEKAKIHLEYIEDEERADHDNEWSNPKLKTLNFTQKVVQRLKEKVKGKVTSYEAICGHIWKHVSKAREHKRDKKVSFVSIVNMRNRLEPPLGNAYFGNAFMWTMATATAGQLEDEDLGTTCKRIQKALASCTTYAYLEWLHWLEMHDRDAILDCCLLNGARLRASSSHNFPVFKLDFGWGKPCVARFTEVEEVGKAAFFPGSDTRGDIDIIIALPLEVMHRLENDDAFMNP